MTENTMNEKQRTSIFRKEALQRFERQEHGPMLLARSNHSWLLVSLAFAITFFCTLYLFLGSYRPRATVSGILVPADGARSEEHTSELQSQSNLVCRLLLEKKNKIITMRYTQN